MPAAHIRQSCDFSSPGFSPERRSDLAISLEVAEHLPSSSAAAFITTLVKAAPCICFSAALPHQGGVRHLNELAQCVTAGYEAHVVFVIQMSNVHYFTPNNAMHPAFGAALAEARAAGVKVAALDCAVTENELHIGEPVRIKLESDRGASGPCK